MGAAGRLQEAATACMHYITGWFVSYTDTLLEDPLGFESNADTLFEKLKFVWERRLLIVTRVLGG